MGSASRRTLCALWLLGLFNNSLFVVLNAGATSISSGSVGLVYLFNTLPTLLVQGAGPYFFHLVSHTARVRLCCALFTASICTVAASRSMWLQLVGVGLGSIAQGLGEASMLGLCSHYGERGVTAWSSGTGFAGIFGYAWKALWVDAVGLSFSTTLLLSLVLPAGFVGAFEGLLDKPPALRASVAPLLPAAAASQAGAQVGSAGADVDADADAGDDDGSPLSTSERMRVFASLWPFTVPLFVVYVSEYAMQSGAWASIGFPVESKHSRDRFYLWSNWLYQVGVFISRSSGYLVQMNLPALWAMPMAQAILLGFFVWDAVSHAWWSNSLLLLCLLAGLLGGSVYVQSYCIMNRPGSLVRPRHREFAMSAASVAATAGCAVAEALGILIQGCLFGAQGISDEGRPPTFTCGYNFSAPAPLLRW